jgi:hypothetical protein
MMSAVVAGQVLALTPICGFLLSIVIFGGAVCAMSSLARPHRRRDHHAVVQLRISAAASAASTPAGTRVRSLARSVR